MTTRSTPSPLLPALGLAAGLAIAVSQYFIWVYAPLEQTMGLVQKIFYFHLPLAWWSLVSFFVVFVASAGYLLKRDPVYHDIAGAAGEVGVLFASLALVTGSLWARFAWGVWWTWDPRLTTTLIMWFVYAAYLLLRSMDMNPERRQLVCAVLGVVAFLDVPLVFLSARLWRSIHPAVFASKGGGLAPEMKTTLFICLGAWVFLWLSLVLLRHRQLRQQASLDEQTFSPLSQGGDHAG